MSRDPIRLSLFDAEDETFRARDLTVAGATRADLDEFCHRHHYAAHAGSASWRYGLWSGATLLGVVAYNLPSMSVCRSVFGPEHAAHVWHMGRLVCDPAAPRNSASRLIGGSLRLIARDHPEVWAVLTYADTARGHLGYVYQATNALYTGVGGMGGGSSYLLTDTQGRSRSRNQGGVNISTAEALARGWVVDRPQPKHRYVYLLGDRRQRRHLTGLLRFPVMPYPK